MVRAAPVRGDREWSPRRLFNAGLEQEESGNLTRAVQLYMSARLSSRYSIADQIYARGAGLRLVRILADFDDDAATAAAVLVEKESRKGSTDLAPLIRTYIRRIDRDRSPLAIKRGTIVSIRFRKDAETAVVELDLGDDEHLLVHAKGTVGPFSAGDPVRMIVRRDRSRAHSGWRLIAMAHGKADGWQLLSVSGLPGEPGPAYGQLLHQ